MISLGIVRQSSSFGSRLAGRRFNDKCSVNLIQRSNQVQSSFANSPQRTFHSSPISQLSSKTIKDPNHPNGLYFHPLKESNQYAISLLSQPPSSVKSSSIMAFIQDQKGEGEIYEIAVQKPNLVQTNKSFVELMHAVLKEKGVPQDGLLEYEAYLRTEGFAHVNDQRHQLMPGRIATPENIIATVAFTDSKIHPDTYEPNDVYRIVTAEEGFIQLRPNWLDLIVEKCKQVN